MLAVVLPEQDTKGFMEKLLKEDVFDSFDTRSACVVSFVRFDVTSVVTSPKTEEMQTPKATHCSWQKLRPFVFSMIKSGGKPNQMKIVFSLPNPLLEEMFPQASALFLNILFENNQVFFTTGSAQKHFAMDKSLENAWDDHVKSFLLNQNIHAVEVM